MNKSIRKDEKYDLVGRIMTITLGLILIVVGFNRLADSKDGPISVLIFGAWACVASGVALVLFVSSLRNQPKGYFAASQHPVR